MGEDYAGPWFWCLRHERVEGPQRCPADLRMGPYATRAEAERWLERAEARNQHWEEQDERWDDEPE